MSAAAVADSTGSLATARAFDRATRSVMPALRGYAHRLTRDRAQSEDLVQETLLRAWVARERFIPNTNLKAWLFRIEYNCFISILRKTRRLVQLDPDMQELRLSAPATQEEGLLMRDLQLAIASLPSTQVAALALINNQELRYQEAADRTGVPIGTMKSRTTRARSAVKTFLDAPLRAVQSPARTLGNMKLITAPQDAVSRPQPSRYEAWKASGQRTIG